MRDVLMPSRNCCSVKNQIQITFQILMRRKNHFNNHVVNDTESLSSETHAKVLKAFTRKDKNSRRTPATIFCWKWSGTKGAISYGCGIRRRTICGIALLPKGNLRIPQSCSSFKLPIENHKKRRTVDFSFCLRKSLSKQRETSGITVLIGKVCSVLDKQSFSFSFATS